MAGMNTSVLAELGAEFFLCQIEYIQRNAHTASPSRSLLNGIYDHEVVGDYERIAGDIVLVTVQLDLAILTIAKAFQFFAQLGLSVAHRHNPSVR